MNQEEQTLSFNKKPPFGSVLDKFHPLSKGLLGFWLLNEPAIAGATAHDLTEQRNGVYSDTFTKDRNLNSNSYFSGNTPDDRVEMGIDAELCNLSGSFTFGCRVYVVDDYRTPFMASYGGSDNTTMLGIGSGNQAFFAVKAGGSQSGPNDSIACPTDRYVDIVGVSDGVTLSLYTDGIFVGSDTYREPSFGSTGFFLGRGTLWSGDDTHFVGWMEYAFVYNRALAPVEVLQIHQNPYQMIKPVLSLELITPPGVFITDFSEYSLGVPDDWTEYWITTTFNLAIVTGGEIGDNLFHFNMTSADNRAACGWDAPGDIVNSEILCKVNKVTGAEDLTLGPGVRLSGGTDENGYALFLDGSANIIKLRRYVAGSGSANLATFSHTIDADEWYWIRFRAEDDNFKAKIWDDGDIEPESWGFDYTDPSPYLTSGASGFVDYRRDGWCDYIAITVDGSTAPLPTLDRFYDNEITIEVDNTKIDSDLTHFPLTLVLNSSAGISGFDATDFFDKLAYTNVDDDFTGINGDFPNIAQWEAESRSTNDAEIQENALHLISTTAINNLVGVSSVFRFAASEDFSFDFDWSMPGATSGNGSAAFISIGGVDDPLLDYVQLARIITGTGAADYLRSQMYIDGALSGSATTTQWDTISPTKVRITRVAGTIKTWYYTTSWILHGTYTHTDIQGEMVLSMVSTCWTDYPDLTFEVDNFTVNSGTIIWPDNTNPNRKKIAITKDDKLTQLYGDMELYDDTNEKAVIHVSREALVLSSTGITTFYLYYDSLQPDNTTYISDSGGVAAQSVWDDNYTFVAHMAQDPSGAAPQIIDSTSNNEDGTSVGTMLTEDLVDVDVGKAIEFDGSDDLIQLTNPIVSALPCTFEVSVSIGAIGAVEGGIGSTYSTGAGYYRGVFFYIDTNGEIFLFYGDGTDNDSTGRRSKISSTLATTSTKTIAASVNGATDMAIYLDGSEAGGSYSGSGGALDPGTPGGSLGAVRSAGTNYFGALSIGEVRWSDIIRSAAWIKATHYAMADDLLSYGQEEVETIEAPEILPVSGAYSPDQEITISCGTSGTTIYYTEDGSDPDETDTEYTAPFELGEAKTIKAIGIKTGLDDSEIASNTYTLIVPQPIITILT